MQRKKCALALHSKFLNSSFIELLLRDEREAQRPALGIGMLELRSPILDQSLVRFDGASRGMQVSQSEFVGADTGFVIRSALETLW
jgi:hypothetical protein